MFEVVARGMEHSTLERNVRAAAAAAGIAVGEDEIPEQVIFVRSDQYSFVKRGMPAIFPAIGFRDRSGTSEANRATVKAWYGTHYHQPSDQWNDGLRGDWMEKEVRLYFLIGLSVATDTAAPRWRPESPFATPRSASGGD